MSEGKNARKTERRKGMERLVWIENDGKRTQRERKRREGHKGLEGRDGMGQKDRRARQKRIS